MKTERLKDDTDATKGFVISFDDDTPKKPKPELKTRRISQTKKNSFMSEPMGSDGSNSSRKENVPPELMICIVSIAFGMNYSDAHITYFRLCVKDIHEKLIK